MGPPPTSELGSIGMADSLILMVLALVVFGPRRLPQIGRQIGKLMYEFRKASNDFKFQMEEELRLSEEADRRKKEEEQRKLLAASPSPQESVSATPALVKAMETTDPAANTSPPDTGTAPAILPPSTGETVASMRRSELIEMNPPPAETLPGTSEQARPESQPVAGADSPAGPATDTRGGSDHAMEAASHNG